MQKKRSSAVLKHFFLNINTGNAGNTVGAILQIILQMFFDAAGNNNCQWEAALLSIVKLEA